MWNKPKDWLLGPARFGDEDTSRGALIIVAAQLCLVLLPLYGVGSLLFVPPPPFVYALLTGLWVVAWLALWTSRRGRHQLAPMVVVVGMWTVVTALVLGTGVHTHHMGAYAPVIVASGLLLSTRATAFITILSCGVILVAHFLDRSGVYGVPGPPTDVLAPIVQLIATGGFISGLMYAFSRALSQLRAKQEELETSRQNLQRAEKMEAFGQLAGGVAHDFNNILTGMLGHIDLIRLRLAELEAHDLDRDLMELERSAERGAAITRQLLAFSRQRKLDRGSSDLAQVVSAAEVMLRRLVREDIRIHMEAEDTGFAPLASSAVEQVLMNLILNAADAMPKGGAISIRSWSEMITAPREVVTGELLPGCYVVMAVADSGNGIDPEVLPRIFEPFFTTKPTGKGTGLGLATVHGVIQRAGGEIDASSVPGEGTEFTIYLPQTSDEPSAVTPSVSLPAPPQKTTSILVCEDDETILAVMVKALKKHGYRVVGTSDAHEALRAGRELGEQLDLLVTDVIMPEMNGRQLAEALGRDVPGLRVLYVSGYTAGLLQDLGIDEDDERLLSKPFTPYVLLKRVNSTLSSTPNPPRELEARSRN